MLKGQKAQRALLEQRMQEQRIAADKLLAALLARDTDSALSALKTFWDVNRKFVTNNNDEMTFLHIAALGGMDKVVEELLNLGAMTREFTKKDRYTPLDMVFCSEDKSPEFRKKQKAVMRLLLIKDPALAILHSTKEITSPLHHMASHDEWNEHLELTLQYFADLSFETRDSAGRKVVLDINMPLCGFETTPLHAAVEKNAERNVDLLLRFGADANLFDSFVIDGKVVPLTPLHHAARSGQLKIAQLLVQHNADPDAENVNGQKPSNMASTTEMEEYLRKEEMSIFRICAKVISENPSLIEQMNNDEYLSLDARERARYLVPAFIEQRNRPSVTPKTDLQLSVEIACNSLRALQFN